MDVIKPQTPAGDGGRAKRCPDGRHLLFSTTTRSTAKEQPIAGFVAAPHAVHTDIPSGFAIELGVKKGGCTHHRDTTCSAALTGSK